MFSRDGSPGLFSGTVSPCSSIRSGAFTPSVVRIKRHSLAPGSSLLQMSSACETPCCDSGATSPCLLTPHARHRLPPSQLSLLTAILRKGRLPVLSSAFQRSYTPCWPISPVNMSSCSACSAASSVAPMNISKAKSCTSIDRPRTESYQVSKTQLWKPDHNYLSVSSSVRTPDETHWQNHQKDLNHVDISPILQNTALHQAYLQSRLLILTCWNQVTKEIVYRQFLALFCAAPYPGWTPHLLNLSVSSTENQKNPSVSVDRPASIEPNKPLASLMQNNETKSHDKSEKYSLALKQGQKSSEISNAPYLKNRGSSSDNLDSSVSKPAQNSCKFSSFPTLKHTIESHSNSISPVLSHKESKHNTIFQNGGKSYVERGLLSSPAFRLSPSPRPVGLTRLSYTSASLLFPQSTQTPAPPPQTAAPSRPPQPSQAVNSPPHPHTPSVHHPLRPYGAAHQTAQMGTVKIERYSACPFAITCMLYCWALTFIQWVACILSHSLPYLTIDNMICIILVQEQ